MEYGSENRDARRDCSGRNKAFPVSRLPLIIGVQTVPDASFAVGIYSWQTGELAQQQCCTKEAGSSWLGYVMSDSEIFHRQVLLLRLTLKHRAVHIEAFQSREAVVSTDWTLRTVLVNEETVN